MIIALVVLICLFLVCAGLWYYQRLHTRLNYSDQSLQLLQGQLKLEQPEFHKYPVRTLGGLYYSFPVAIECIRKQGKQGQRNLYRVQIECSQVNPLSLTIQSAVRPGKVTHLYGKNVVFTEDNDFERQIIVVSADPGRAKKILTGFVRKRLMEVASVDFMLDMAPHVLLLEIIERQPDCRLVANVISTAVEVCHATQLAAANKE